MGYTTRNGRFANTLACAILAAAAPDAANTHTASFDSAALELGDRGTVRLTLAVKAASGTLPTLDVALQTSPDGTTWSTVASFTQATGVTSQYQVVGGIDRFVRAHCTIGGTNPSFTFSLDGEAV